MFLCCWIDRNDVTVHGHAQQAKSFRKKTPCNQETTLSSKVCKVFLIMGECTEDGKKFVHLKSLVNLSVSELYRLLEPWSSNRVRCCWLTNNLPEISKRWTYRSRFFSYEDTSPNQKTSGNTKAFLDGFDIFFVFTKTNYLVWEK